MGTAGIKRIPVVVIKEDRKMKQLFEKNKSKNNGTAVHIVEIAANPKNLDTKVVTYDPLENAPRNSGLSDRLSRSSRVRPNQRRARRAGGRTRRGGPHG